VAMVGADRRMLIVELVGRMVGGMGSCIGLM